MPGDGSPRWPCGASWCAAAVVDPVVGGGGPMRLVPWVLGLGCRAGARDARATPRLRTERETLQEGQPLQVLVRATTLMVGVGPDADLLLAPVMVVRGVDRGRRADRVHQPHREDGGGRRPGGVVDAVDIGQRPEDRVDLRAVDPDVRRELAVGVVSGELDRAAVVAQERDVDERRPDRRLEARRGEGDPAALAPAEDDDPIRVDRVVGLGGIDGADGVGEDPAIEVRRRIQDARGSGSPGTSGWSRRARRRRCRRAGRPATNPGPGCP